MPGQFMAWRHGGAVVVLADGSWPSGTKRPKSAPATVPVLTVIMPRGGGAGGGEHAWLALTPDALEDVADKKGLAASDCNVLLRDALSKGRFRLDRDMSDDTVVMHADFGEGIGDVAWRLGVDERDLVGDRLLGLMQGLAAAPVAHQTLVTAPTVPVSFGERLSQPASASTAGSPMPQPRPPKRARSTDGQASHELDSLTRGASAGLDSLQAPGSPVVGASEREAERSPPPRRKPRGGGGAMALNPGVGRSRRKRKPGALG